MKLSESNKPRELTIRISRMLHAGHLRSDQSPDLAHYKPMGEYRNYSFGNINDIIRTQTKQILNDLTYVYQNTKTKTNQNITLKGCQSATNLKEDANVESTTRTQKCVPQSSQR